MAEGWGGHRLRLYTTAIGAQGDRTGLDDRPLGGGQPSLVTPQSVDVPVVQRDGLVLTSLKINTVQIVSDIPSLVRLEVAGRRFDGTAVVGLNTSAQVRQAVADSRS